MRFRWPWQKRGGVAAPPRSAGAVIVIGGRRFVPATRFTARHDDWIMGVRARTGLNDVIQGPEEGEADYGIRLLGALQSSGATYDLLGGLLLPAGEERWTPEMAAETSAFLGDLWEEHEKDQVRPLMLEIYLRFFSSGRRSSTSSPPSSPNQTSLHGLLERMTLSASGAR